MIIATGVVVIIGFLSGLINFDFTDLISNNEYQKILDETFGTHFSHQQDSVTKESTSSSLSNQKAKKNKFKTSSLQTKNQLLLKWYKSQANAENYNTIPEQILIESSPSETDIKMEPSEDDLEIKENDNDSEDKNENHPPIAITKNDVVFSDFNSKSHNLLPLALDGRDSYDPDGDPIFYSWIMIQGPSKGQVFIQNPTSPITGVSFTKEGVYRFALIVHDNQYKSRPAIVKIFVQEKNSSPIAIIDGPTKGIPKKPLIFSGESSQDPENDPLTFLWKMEVLPEKSFATIKNPTSAKINFTPDVSGEYKISLVVSDGKSMSAPQTHTLIVKNTSDSSIDILVDLNLEFYVNETKLIHAQIVSPETKDSSENKFSIQWQLVSQPPNSHPNYEEIQNDLRFKTDTEGPYIIRTALLSQNKVWVEKNIHLNVLPQVSEGNGLNQKTNNNPSDKEEPPFVQIQFPTHMNKCFSGEKIKLDASESYSNTHRKLEYSWEIKKSPPSSKRSKIENAQSSIAYFIPDWYGEYTVELKAFDPYTRASDSIETKITLLRSKLDVITYTDLTDLWKSKDIEISDKSWYGAKVLYGPNNFNIIKTKCQITDQKTAIEFLRNSGRVNIRQDNNSKESQNDLGCEDRTSHDSGVKELFFEGEKPILSIRDDFETDKKYYFTFFWWHKFLGIPIDYVNTRFWFIKRQIDSQECFEIKNF